MDEQTSARMNWPLLAPGQAQKEVTHNEALALADLAVQACVEAVGLDEPPSDPRIGACWIVGAAPVGDWTGRAQALAGWTGGGWRFLTAHEGMAAWSIADRAEARFDGAGWAVGNVAARRLLIGGLPVVGPQATAIPVPIGGATIDGAAREAIAAILAALRSHGLIAT